MHPQHPLKPFAIPTHWTDDQALAVVDFLDELSAHIWAIYHTRLLDAYRDLAGTGDTDAEPAGDDLDF